MDEAMSSEVLPAEVTVRDVPPVEVVGPAPRWQEYMRLDEILAAAANPKQHDDALIDQSISRFGFVEPITLDERTGRLISGHGRCAALRAVQVLGEVPPDGVTLDAEGRYMVPVNRGWASASDEEAEAALIVLNRATERGGWDASLLPKMLERIAERSASGLRGVGYSDKEAKAMLDKLSATAPSLKQLREKHGRMEDPRDMWPEVRVKVPPEMMNRWESWCRASPDEPLHQRLDVLLEAGGV